jgi:hypothetical protein
MLRPPHRGLFGLTHTGRRDRGDVALLLDMITSRDGRLSSGMNRPSRSDVILRKLDSGELPASLPSRMTTGSGSGAPCDACGGRIQSHQIEYEWGYPGQSRVFRMHLGCVGLWQALRRKRALDRAV